MVSSTTEYPSNHNEADTTAKLPDSQGRQESPQPHCSQPCGRRLQLEDYNTMITNNMTENNAGKSTKKLTQSEERCNLDVFEISELLS